MAYNPEIHNRKSIRLSGYNYSRSGAYFVTICSHKKEMLFSFVKKKNLIFSEIGEIINAELDQAMKIRNEIIIDTFVIMPNHIHMIVFISNVGANGNSPKLCDISRDGVNYHSPLQMQSRSLSTFIVGFKSSVSRKLGYSVWQKNYYDHIIRNKKELAMYRKYIKNNPAKWKDDEYFM